MLICSRSECQTTAGCAHRGPNGQLCYWPGHTAPLDPNLWLHKVGSLSQFTDEEIAAEHYRRMLANLGDPRVGVTMSSRT